MYCGKSCGKIFHFHKWTYKPQSAIKTTSFLSLFFIVSLENCPQQINNFDGISHIRHSAALEQLYSWMESWFRGQ